MARIDGKGLDEERAAGRSRPGLPTTPTAVSWQSSMNGRRLARGLIVLGLSCLITAFFLKAAADLRVGSMFTGVAVIELGGLLAIRSRGPIRGLRRASPRYAFALAGVIAAGYIGLTLLGNPMVRASIGMVTPLKFAAILAALVAGVFEETLFRGVLMDRLAAAGRSSGLQVLVSGLVFGCLHFYSFAGLPAALMAQAATTVLGWALAALYLASKRSLWPCIIAHVLIDGILEPSLLLGFIH